MCSLFYSPVFPVLAHGPAWPQGSVDHHPPTVHRYMYTSDKNALFDPPLLPSIDIGTVPLSSSRAAGIPVLRSQYSHVHYIHYSRRGPCTVQCCTRRILSTVTYLYRRAARPLLVRGKRCINMFGICAVDVPG